MRKNVNADLKKLYDWLCANRLSLNAGKSEFLLFLPTRHKTYERYTLNLHHLKLFESKKIKYLGLILDNKLDLKCHMAELTKKLSRAIGLIHKMKGLCPISVLRSLYRSLFNSHLSYGLVVWGNACRWNLEKIRSLQKIVLRLFAPGHNGDFNHILSDLKIFRPISSVRSAIIVTYVGLRSRYSTHISKTTFQTC